MEALQVLHTSHFVFERSAGCVHDESLRRWGRGNAEGAHGGRARQACHQHDAAARPPRCPCSLLLTMENGEEDYGEGKIFYGEGTRVNRFYITMEDVMSQITASGSGAEA